MVSPTHTPQHQFSTNPPPAYTRAPSGSQFLAPPTSHTHHSRLSSHTSSTTSSREEEPEVLSLPSSEGGVESGNFSSYESSSGSSERSRPSTYSRSNSGPPSPYRSHDMPLRARDIPTVPHDVPLRARGPPEMAMPRPPLTEPKGGIDGQSHDQRVATPTSGEDYTRRIRYPNNSRVLVPPLKDEDISLKSEGGGILRARDPPIVQGKEDKGTKEPMFCDRSKFDFYQRQYQHQQQQQLRGQSTLFCKYLMTTPCVYYLMCCPVV